MIPEPKTQIDKLIYFQNRNKFSTEAWNNRGLNPSSEEMCNQLTDYFNSCAGELIELIRNNASDKKLKAVLKSNLNLFNKSDYDTEEREFICSLFEELSKIIEINFSDNLNQWLYGSVLSTLFKVQDIFSSKKIIKKLQQPCANCSTLLETHVTKMQADIPETGWPIVKCKNCNELNLLTLIPGIKQLKSINYEWIDTLSNEDYNYEQAVVRLNQIKFFRK